MNLKEGLEFRVKTIEERLHLQEEGFERRVEHLENRLKQVNMKFERIEQLGDRLESLSSLFDQLKHNLDAKLQVYDDKLGTLGGKVQKLRTEELQQLYQLVKKAFNSQKEIALEMQHIKTRDIRQSEVLMKQSSALGERVQSPVLHQRVESYQRNDRLRSITLEKEQRLRQETEEDERRKQEVQWKQSEFKHQDQNEKRKPELASNVDKYQFTLQNKADENMIRLTSKKSETLEHSKLIQPQQSLLERTISQEHMYSLQPIKYPRSKYLSSTNHMREQLKNLRK